MLNLLKLNHIIIEKVFRVESVTNIQIQLHIDYDINETTCKFSVTFRIVTNQLTTRQAIKSYGRNYKSYLRDLYLTNKSIETNSFMSSRDFLFLFLQFLLCK